MPKSFIYDVVEINTRRGFLPNLSDSGPAYKENKIPGMDVIH